MAPETQGMSHKILLVTAVVVIVFVLFGWLYTQLEYEIVEDDAGYQGEARYNQYLAAEFFLRKMGQKSEQIKLFSDRQKQLNADDTLLVPSVRLAFDRRRSNAMLDWVRQGGHLIITGQPETENDSSYGDYILDQIGLFIERQSLEENSTQLDDPVNVVIDNEFLQVDFDDYLVILQTEDFNARIIWLVDDDDRTHAIQIQLGKGRLTLLSDIRLFKNNEIEHLDNAAFLFLLSGDQLVSADGGIFYYSLFEDQMSLLQWLWENAQLLITSLLLLAVITLWMIIPRFGPLINVNQPVRRQFLDHLNASGNYHWRQGHYTRLLTDVRKQLSHAINLKYPEWSNLNRQDQIMHFSELSQLQAPAIEDALFEIKIDQISDFVNKIKILEILRKSL
jgi:uncharacterized protein DUF4350